MGLADYPMGVVGEARLITMHTRTHIQKNIQIFGADELETYVSPWNWKPKQSCLSAGFYVLLLEEKSIMNIEYWKKLSAASGFSLQMPLLLQCSYPNDTDLRAGRWWGCSTCVDGWSSQECMEALVGNENFRRFNTWTRDIVHRKSLTVTLKVTIYCAWVWALSIKGSLVAHLKSLAQRGGEAGLD